MYPVGRHRLNWGKDYQKQGCRGNTDEEAVFSIRAGDANAGCSATSFPLMVSLSNQSGKAAGVMRGPRSPFDRLRMSGMI